MRTSKTAETGTGPLEGSGGNPAPPPQPRLTLTPGNFGEIARRSGITRQQVSRILRGITQQPGMDTVLAIAEAAGCSLSYLVAHLARTQSAARRRRSRG